jgi:hypothetical protein
MPKWSTAVMSNWAIKRQVYHRLSDGELQWAFEKFQHREKSNIKDCLNFTRSTNNEEIGITAMQKSMEKWLIVSVWRRKLY